MNRSLAERLLTQQSEKPGKKKEGEKEEGEETNPLRDDRFSAMFSNADFEVDEASEEFQRLHPLLSHRDKKRAARKIEREEAEEEVRGRREGVVRGDDG